MSLKRKNPRIKPRAFKLVGMARLERATPRSQSECATNCATSRIFQFGVSDGDRTHDPQNHNLMLYQLSYTHHRSLQGARCLNTRSKAKNED